MPRSATKTAVPEWRIRFGAGLRGQVSLAWTLAIYVAQERPLHVRVHARSKDLWDRHVVAIQPSSREKTAHDLRVGELQWPPEEGENVTNRTVKPAASSRSGVSATTSSQGEVRAGFV